ncbi:adenosylcobinamide-GDP ribazoletransferase [Thalassotalea sp. PLHSN55]|uniref:adenosylcobinamide-GDP ribazoletransferase n=1 Tax=Thalassotalea sp. PLHSN55 TaxID=3435888 RepID=UPI003F843285
MNWKVHYHLLLLAISFFTRVPVRLPEDVSSEMLNQASRYFGVVGIFVGIVAATVFALSTFIFPVEIAVLLAMATSIIFTGAFHEDGWADVWDGFGGGWQVEQKLNIMKDSRIGTYGSVALIVLLMVKFQSLVSLNQYYSLISALVLGHCLSRVLATSLIYTMNYVQEDALSKVKPLAQALSFNGLMVLSLTGIVVAFFALPIHAFFTLLLTLLVFRWLLVKWFNHQLGGYTGDCLGAAQQLCEVVIYLFLLGYFGQGTNI